MSLHQLFGMPFPLSALEVGAQSPAVHIEINMRYSLHDLWLSDLATSFYTTSIPAAVRSLFSSSHHLDKQLPPSGKVA